MIALTVKALRALRRKPAVSTQPGDALTSSESPVQHLLNRAIAWTVMPRTSDRFEAVVAGHVYELHNDGSEQGPRFVISQDGEYLAELGALPPRWTLEAD